MPRKAPASSRQEVKEEIRAIGTISTWLLGFLALIIAALISFTFTDLSEVTVEYNFIDLKLAILVLLDMYLFIAFNILWMLIVSFAFPDDETKGLQKRLRSLKSIFKWNIVTTMVSLFLVLIFVSYFLYS